MYKRHNLWEEEKWDIHSSGSGGYAGHSSEESHQEYHKSETYNTNKPDEDKIKAGYRVNEKEEEKKKEDEEKEKTIVDSVEQEEKYQKNKEEEDQSQSIKKDIQSTPEMIEGGVDKNKDSKKKHEKSIEEAIKDAIKGEKELVFVD